MNITARPKLTILTPAWNRADLLPRLFRSIADQTPADGSVEWLVIDDGSTDNTPQVLAGFGDERPDLMRVLRVENGGKHRAINRAAHDARGDWIMITDSDDAVSEDAVFDVMRAIERYDIDDSIGMIRGLKSFPDSEQPAYCFLKPDVPIHHWEWVSSQATRDTAEVIRRSALILHPFPEYENERFMSEGWLWHVMDTTHRIVCINRPWMDCWYQNEGLSARALHVRLDSLRSTMEVYRMIANSPASWKVRARALINAWRYRFHAVAGGVIPSLRPSLCFALPGWLLYWNDRMRLLSDRTK